MNVALVQSGFTAKDYESADSFGARVTSLVDRALDVSDPPSLVAFPELTGMWLPLFAEGVAGSTLALAAGWIARHPLSAARSLLRGRGLSFVFTRGWRRHLETWLAPFRDAAARHAVYICPGSTFLPGIDRNATRDWEMYDRRVWNTACLLNPRGRILALTRKVYPTADELRLGVSRGSPADLEVVQTEIGRVGILICLDGFYESLVSRLDGQGAGILIQPSANPVPWKAVWSRGRWVSGPAGKRPGELTQEAQWLEQGIGSLIQGRENIRASINPMSVSRVLGHNDEGQSTVFHNGAGLVARAGPWDRETVLHARI